MYVQNSPFSADNEDFSSDAISDQEPSQHSTPDSRQTRNTLDTIDGRLSKILSRANQSLSQGDQRGAIRQLTLLGEKINFLKNNKRDFDVKIELLCFYNLSCAYQSIAFHRSEVSAMEDCTKHAAKALKVIQNLTKKNICPQSWFKLTAFKVRMSLQYCAFLSQLDKHQEALDISIQTVGEMIGLFKKGLARCIEQMKQIIVESDDAVSFAHSVLKKAKDQLSGLGKVQSYEEVMGADHEQFRKIKQNNYFWKDNFENNEKALRKKLQVEKDPQSNRNILGLKVNEDWLSEYTIGKIMHMRPVRYEEIMNPDNIVIEFSYRNIIEKIILTAVAYFSIATEMRFLENDKPSKNKNPKDEEKKEFIKKSQIFHLKAIEIVCKFVKGSSLLVDHLINSYHRHYHNDLVPIQEEPSYAEQSMASILSKKNSSQNEQEQLRTPQLAHYFSDYTLILQEPNEEQEKIKKEPIFVFKKKKKNVNLLESGQMDGSLVARAEREHDVWTNERNSKKMQNKLEKSSSISNYHSLKVDKKSFSSRAKDSTTIRISKSPEPSIQIKSKSTKLMKKNFRRLKTQRG